MNFKQSRLVLFARSLAGCPVVLLESSLGSRVPGSEVYFVSGYDIESMSLSLLPADGVGKAVLADLSAVRPLARSVAVVGKNVPLFFMDEKNRRVYCTPNVHDLTDLTDLSVEIRIMDLDNFLRLSLLSGEFVLFRNPYFSGLFVGCLEYCGDDMYVVRDVYKVSSDKKSVEPFRISELVVSIDDIVTGDSTEKDAIIGIYSQVRALPNERKEGSDE